ncbi:MAG: CPBP family intramembrane glutamic endopeptidase [Coprobacillaceae bacterium]
MIKNNKQIILYYLMTYLLTGVLFILTMILNAPLFLAAPAIVAIIFVHVTKYKGGVISFIRQLFFKKFNISWLLVAILLPTIACIIVILIYCQIKNIPFTLHDNPTGTTNAFLLLWLIGGCFGEEIGWRGYLQPLLLNRFESPLKTSIILGVMWGLWHAGDYGEGIGFLLFVVFTICLSIIMTWLYYKANGNVLVAILFHLFINLPMNYIGVYPDGTVPSVTYRLVGAIVYLSIAIFLILKSDVYKKDFNT